ncbi:MAG: aromatic ring-hydroxylating oxygenase subunit alpha [Rhizobiaceae bacterium]
MPQQLLPKEAYTSDDWYDRERKEIFSRTWSLIALTSDFSQVGDFVADTVNGYPLAVVQNADGDLRAFHNLCRHRGTELLEGRGNAGKSLVCPYHRWTYGLDGQLRGLPDRAECFPDLDRKEHALMEAGIGVWKGMVFVNPDPGQSFADWIGPMAVAEFPHDVTDKNLVSGEEFVYRMRCNWKVFYENAIDGYHLAYLHENTLGGPATGLNEWQSHGQNMVWYSTERDGIRNRIPKFVEEQAAGHSIATIKGAETPGYGGVYMLYPSTIVTPSPWSLTISRLEPVDPDTTILRARTWVANSWWRYSESPAEAEGYDKETGLIESRNWKKHPLETGDFQTEDIWVCEKMQRSLHSPKYACGPLSQGSGGEAMLEVFQRQVLDACGST